MLSTRKRIVAAVAAGIAVLSLSACGADFMEEFNDAPVSSNNDKPAETYSFPDGFTNVASKCDNHGNRIFVTRIANDGRGIAVVPNDPSCNN